MNPWQEIDAPTGGTAVITTRAHLREAGLGAADVRGDYLVVLQPVDPEDAARPMWARTLDLLRELIETLHPESIVPRVGRDEDADALLARLTRSVH
ncbi:MAG: hypothetical protein GEV05_27405 [Betaproteobacteria bacterium]|nr:hypothetical protein [Betaproteobacteria bacterium]